VTDGLLALGLVLTTATQWRLAGLPLGIGEICLVVWLGLMSCACLQARRTSIGPALSRLLLFWGPFVISLSIGTINGLAIGERYDPKWFLHDTFAYPLIAAVCCFSVIEPGAYSRLHRTAWIFLVLSGISLTVLLLSGTLLRLPGVDPWFWDRFRGWSQNPGQLAELSLVATLVGLYLADVATKARNRFIAILLMIPVIWAGRITQTDAYTYGVTLAFLLFLGVKLFEWAITPGPRASLAFLTLFALPVLVASAVPVMISAVSGGDVVAVLSKNGGKEAQSEADLRFTLWGEALTRGIEVGVLGLGPGPHLPIPAELAAARAAYGINERPTDVSHPQQGAANNFEAHNTVLDLFVQGGLIAVMAYVWVMVCALMCALRSRSAGLVALICGLNLFALAAFAIRLPLFWLAVELCLVARREAPASWRSQRENNAREDDLAPQRLFAVRDRQGMNQ
jgi:hypothetical protein